MIVAPNIIKIIKLEASWTRISIIRWGNVSTHLHDLPVDVSFVLELNLGLSPDICLDAIFHHLRVLLLVLAPFSSIIDKFVDRGLSKITDLVELLFFLL